MEKEDFDYELQDDLFDQLAGEVQNTANRNSQASTYYQKTFAFNHLRRLVEEGDSKPDFVFNLVLNEKILSVKNEENPAKLILNLLNALFLWFDLGILDLHPIFTHFHDYVLVYLYLHLPVYLCEKITQLMLFGHKWLKKLEPLLYELLDPLKANPCDQQT